MNALDFRRLPETRFLDTKRDAAGGAITAGTIRNKLRIDCHVVRTLKPNVDVTGGREEARPKGVTVRGRPC